MELPTEIGVMVLPGATMFPQAMLPLYVFEPRYRKMLQESLETHRMYCVAMRRPGATREVPEPVAGLGLVRAAVGHKNGTSHLILQGLTRIRLGRTVRYKPFRVHEIEPISTTGTGGVAVMHQLKRVKELVAQRLELGAFGAPTGSTAMAAKKMIVQARDILRYLNALEDPEQVADMVACSLLQDASHRQTILETVDLELRLRHLASCLGHEIQRLSHGESSASS